jgi:hypothetical protein
VIEAGAYEHLDARRIRLRRVEAGVAEARGCEHRDDQYGCNDA